MKESSDLYARLGVNPNASDGEIRKAYRLRARELHPDRHPGDAAAEDRFKALTEAYEVLRDGERRRAYDRERAATNGERAPGARPPGQGPPVRPRGQRGRDLKVELVLSLAELARGTRAPVSVDRPERCDACGGVGARPGSVPVVCQTCGGRGAVSPGKGWLSLPRPCKACGGQGRRYAHACSACGGEGRRPRRRRLEVEVPKGVETGTRLRVRGEGEAGTEGGTPGDLYVVVTQKPHPLLERRGADLEVEVPLTVFDAVLGAEVTVPSLDGCRAVRAPAGTASGSETVLAGHGMPKSDGSGRGDLRIRWVVEPPGHLTTEQRNLLERVRDIDRRSTAPAPVARYRERLRDLGEVDR